MLSILSQYKDTITAAAAALTSFIGIIALYITSKYTSRQFRLQQKKVLVDTLNSEDSRMINDFLNALVAVLIGAQRVLITYANDKDISKLRNLIHEANIWPIKLSVYLLSDPPKTNLMVPLTKLSELVLARRGEDWDASMFNRAEFDRLFAEIQTDGAKIIAEYRGRIERRVQQLES